jgi:uncharacterized protein YdaU (DUF1376 family)
MSATPFMPLWVADFVGDTLDLGAKEIGAYLLILMAMWGRDGYLPNDAKKLQRVARCGRDWPDVWAAIRHYFTADGDRVTQGRLLKELQKVASKRKVNAQSGALGGSAKALKYKESVLANAKVSPKQPEPYLEPERKEDMGKPISPADKPPVKAPMPDGWVLSEEGWAYARSQGIPDKVIEDEARGFQAYWADRRDRDAKKSERGWEQCWANRCRSIAGRYAGRSVMAGSAQSSTNGRGHSLASIVAERWRDGQGG